ncbi:MAG TPA: hypothetical protein G4N96_04345 [Chloroflexi bacterium]|nr:hypothetical protein [Chloroflexota bacterium]
MKINKTLSQELAQEILPPANAGEYAGWYRAFSGLSRLPDACYVEGWMVLQDTFTVSEHAWLEVDNEIIDPVHWQDEATYFSGARFNAAQAQAAMAQKGQLPLTHLLRASRNDTPANSGNPKYWAAWEEATKFAEAQKRGTLWSNWHRWLELIAKRHKDM